MENIAEYFGRQIFWLDRKNVNSQLPDTDWICLAISNSEPNIEVFNDFIRTFIAKGILEFKVYGEFGKKLHDLFNETVRIMETKEKHDKINVLNSWHGGQTLAEVFWQCFFATGLFKTTNSENIKIICIDFDGANRIKELKSYLKEFESGWLPSDNIKHEIWQDPAGFTTLNIALKRGNEFGKSLEPGSKLIHSFYASTHYEAMTIYYKFMNWGQYKIDLQVDEKLYDKKTHLHRQLLDAKRNEVFNNQLPKIFNSSSS